jgi:hypothetical protein
VTHMDITIHNLYRVGSHNFAIDCHFVADRYTTFLWFLIRLILVKLKYSEITVELLDDVCKSGVQASLTLFIQI